MQKYAALFILAGLITLSDLSFASGDTLYGSIGLHRAEWDFGDGVDFTDTGLFSLDLGYMITEKVALELGYQDFGKLSVSDGSASGTAEADAIKLSLLGFLPLNERFSAYAEVGMNFWEGEIAITNVPGFGSGSASTDDSDFFYGVGAKLQLEKQAAFFIEYKIHELDDLDVDTIGAGVIYFLPNRF